MDFEDGGCNIEEETLLVLSSTYQKGHHLMGFSFLLFFRIVKIVAVVFLSDICLGILNLLLFKFISCFPCLCPVCVKWFHMMDRCVIYYD